MSINRQNKNFGFWKQILVQIIADYVYLNMNYFQLFAWFGKILLVEKSLKKSKFLQGHTACSTPLNPIPITMIKLGWDQVHIKKNSGASRSMISTLQNMFRKNWISLSKIIFFFLSIFIMRQNFFLNLKYGC